MSIPTRLQDQADRLLSIALALHGTAMGNIQLVDPETGDLRIIAQRGFGLDFLEHFAVVNTENGSACGRAMLNRKPLMIPDVKTDPLFAVHVNIAEAAGFRAVQSTPLISRNGAFLGVLSTHFRTPGHLAQSKLHWLDWHRRANDLIDQFPSGNRS
jgi:GAF domain-containing protein